MDDARGVRRRDRVANLLEDAVALVHRRRGAREVGLEVLALEQLHREVRNAGRLVDARRDDLDDMVALHARADARFLDELRP